jgi:phosphate/sulfate permease
MSAEESERSRLPFEPNKKRQKPAKTQSKPAAQPKESTKQADRKAPYTKEQMSIPQVVSQRMIRRVVGFCGVPTALGIITLVVSYLLAIYSDIQLPPIAVLLVNGSFLGLGEFNTNWERMVAVWRETRQKNL